MFNIKFNTPNACYGKMIFSGITYLIYIHFFTISNTIFCLLLSFSIKAPQGHVPNLKEIIQQKVHICLIPHLSNMSGVKWDLLIQVIV